MAGPGTDPIGPEFDEGTGPVDLLVYDDEDRRYVPALVALGGVVLAALVVGAVVFLLGRTQSAEPLGGVTAPQAAVVDEPTCGPALERADAALELGDRLERSLSEQTSLMDELLARRATAEQVLDQALPPLTAGAKDRQEFLEAVTAYQQARADCEQ